MDNFDRVVVHLNHRDITMVAASLAPVWKIEAYRKRMGWTFPCSSCGRRRLYHVVGEPRTCPHLERPAGIDLERRLQRLDAG